MTQQKSSRKSGIIGAVLVTCSLFALVFAVAPNNAITDTGGGQVTISTVEYAAPGNTVAIAAPNTPLAETAIVNQSDNVNTAPQLIAGTAQGNVQQYFALNITPANLGVAASSINNGYGADISPQPAIANVSFDANLAITANTGQNQSAPNIIASPQLATANPAINVNANQTAVIANQNVSSVNAFGAEVLTLKGGNCFGTDSALTLASVPAFGAQLTVSTS